MIRPLRNVALSRTHLASLTLSTLVAATLAGCDGRGPLAVGDSAVTDARVVDQRPALDRGCECLTWSPGSGPCMEIFWGCKGSPNRWERCDVWAACVRGEIDPFTGCRRPVFDPNCDPPKGPLCDPKVLGRPCSATNGVGGGECGDPAKTGALCLLTKTVSASELRGVCTCQCVPDDPGTMMVDEDSCPERERNFCGSIKLSDGSKTGFCLRRCEPKLGANDCAPGIACDPRSGAPLELRTTAVCLLYGCQSDADCPVRTATPCKTDGSLSCPAAMGCQPLSPSGVDGRCAKPGLCDKASGLCAPRLKDLDPSAQVGDPCDSDLDCGKTMRCELEEDRASSRKAVGPCVRDRDCCSNDCHQGACSPSPCVVHARNGYCTIAGCTFASLKEFQCPPGSSCHRLFYGGLCQKTCSLQDAKSCRGHVGDASGDYECRAWQSLRLDSESAILVADEPVCDFGDTVSCARSCEPFGFSGSGSPPANPTQMRCRDPQTNAELPTGDPKGLCLDVTKSGP